MIRLCGMRFLVRWVYLQAYVSLILLCCAAYFLVQLLYCQSQIGLFDHFHLELYGCAALCPDYPAPYDAVICCADASFVDCTDKFSCLQPAIAALSSKEDQNGLTMACLFSAVPLLIVLHILLRVYLKRRRALLRAEARLRAAGEERAGMPSLESFLHHDQENECSICLEGFREEKAILLNCGHIFHNQCIRQWGRRKRTCPVCRNQQ